MTIKITWKTTPEVSALHAAAALSTGQAIVDRKLSDVIGQGVHAISDRLAVAEIEIDRFWNNLIAHHGRIKDDRGRVETALLHSGCGEFAADSIAPTISGHLADLKIAFFDAYPKISEQLPLRARVLTEQWEARGPGLMAVIGKLTHRDLIPKKATVTFLQPALGGGGDVHPESGLAWIEAVLANPHQDLPEVVRLGWLLGRLSIGRKAASKLVDAKRLPDLATLALLPIVLQAAREVELVGEIGVSELVEHWNVRRRHSACDPQQLEQWWAQMVAGGTPFPVRLKALDKMIYDGTARN
ncbi:MAG: hypothetical protein R3C05_24435 [Pirellulaceae bacterium]